LIDQEITLVYGLIQQMKMKRGIELESFFKDIGDGDIFYGLGLEKRKEGEAQYELDRAEILASTLYFMKGNFDPLLKLPFWTWMRDSFEHRPWLPTGSAELESWGVEALKGFKTTFEEFRCQHFF